MLFLSLPVVLEVLIDLLFGHLPALFSGEFRVKFLLAGVLALPRPFDLRAGRRRRGRVPVAALSLQTFRFEEVTDAQLLAGFVVFDNDFIALELDRVAM